MCEPTTLTALAVAGTVLAVAGTVTAGIQQSQAAKANAEIIEQQAGYEEARQRERARRVIAQGRAAVGKSGGVVSGSALDVLAGSAEDAELDALAIRWSGGQRAGVSRFEGRSALVSSGFGAGTTLLSGVNAWGSDLWKSLSGGTAGQPNMAVTRT
jgi:hypothetical protein